MSLMATADRASCERLVTDAHAALAEHTLNGVLAVEKIARM
jgi:hypothetical protein